TAIPFTHLTFSVKLIIAKGKKPDNRKNPRFARFSKVCRFCGGEHHERLPPVYRPGAAGRGVPAAGRPDGTAGRTAAVCPLDASRRPSCHAVVSGRDARGAGGRGEPDGPGNRRRRRTVHPGTHGAWNLRPAFGAARAVVRRG